MSVAPHQSVTLDEGSAAGAQRRVGVPVLVSLLQSVVRWRWVILSIVAALLLAGGIVTLLMTPQYTATARLEISRERQNVTNVDTLESPQAGQDVEFYKTQYSLLEARSLAERVSRSLRLATNDEFFAAHGIEPEGNAARLTPVERQAREDRAIKLLLDHISIDPIATSSLVDVSYTSASPIWASRITNEWCEQFIAAGIDRRFASTAYARRVLTTGLADLARRLEVSERAAVNFANRNDIVALGRVRGADGKTEIERTLASSDLDALNTALAAATAERISAESRASSGSDSGTSAEALTNTTIAGLRQRRAEAASEMAKLSVQFEPNYPTVRALREQITALDASIAREVSRVGSSRTAQYQELVAREQDLRSRVDESKGRFGRQQSASIQYNILQREADTNRQLYDSLLQRSKQISVSDVGATNVAVVDLANPPKAPSSPRLLLNLAIALFAGIGLSAIAVFALEQIDEGLREPGDVSRLLGVPLLGSIPKQQTDDKNLTVTLEDAKSELSEAYLSVRSSLAFSSDHGVPRTLMVTSSRAGEGKSTTAAALAIVLGRTGKRVLLIDGDMRSPSVDSIMDCSNAEGLSNFLAGQDDWRGLVQDVGFRNISIMASGPMPPSAAELLSSDRMSRLVQELRETFDHVVIDAPPILGLADAPLLTKAVEGCVFVIEAEGVAVRGLRAALGRLEMVHAHVIGVVLTKLSHRQAGYGYGYGYDYGYGSDKDN
ncbi:GumC family protein [Sphingomonas sp. CFBP 8760]|uniref:GumC family protein n=1 Tax=Sphingomonas sp. CFBP 8760 TaxID=2775282 RepID=UPI001A93651B|nr:polysaccharide biosynthesis tyrosine autokinase [Sphingomonas sp. CFBP 8760]